MSAKNSTGRNEGQGERKHMAKTTKQNNTKCNGRKTSTPIARREDMQAIWQHLLLGVGQSLKNITQTHFISFLSISGFVREPRCSNPVTWNP
jgi:hypothetical protein